MKPCPFCGSSDLYAFEYPYKRREGVRGCYVTCRSCGAKSGNYETTEDAKNAWDKRKDEKE